MIVSNDCVFIVCSSQIITVLSRLQFTPEETRRPPYVRGEVFRWQAEAVSNCLVIPEE